MYPSRRFDVLGLVQRRQPGGPAGQRGSGAPGLGIYSAWLGGLPGFLSGARLPARLRAFVACPPGDVTMCLHGLVFAWQRVCVCSLSGVPAWTNATAYVPVLAMVFAVHGRQRCRA